MSEIDPYLLLQNTFLDLSSNNIRALCEAASVCNYSEGAYICRQGDTGTTLFVIGEGEVDIIVHAEDDHEILVDIIGENITPAAFKQSGDEANQGCLAGPVVARYS